MAIRERDHGGLGVRREAVVRCGRAPGGMEAGRPQQETAGGPKIRDSLQAFGSCCLVTEVSKGRGASGRAQEWELCLG